MSRSTHFLLAAIVAVCATADFALAQVGRPSRSQYRNPRQQISAPLPQRITNRTPSTTNTKRPAPLPQTGSLTGGKSTSIMGRPQLPKNLPARITQNDLLRSNDDSATWANMPAEVRIQQRPAHLPARTRAFQHDRNAAPNPFAEQAVMRRIAPPGHAPSPAVVSGRPQTRMLVIDPTAGIPPYRSPRLKASFIEDPSGVRVVGISPYSPLRGTKWLPGLKVGDVIDSMDGVPVYSDWDLENHVRWTCVDYVDCFTGQYKRTWVYIF